MLKELHRLRKMPFDLTVDQIAVQFAASGVNRAELTALRMYTGPCFEFCAHHCDHSSPATLHFVRDEVQFPLSEDFVS